MYVRRSGHTHAKRKKTISTYGFKVTLVLPHKRDASFPHLHVMNLAQKQLKNNVTWERRRKSRSSLNAGRQGRFPRRSRRPAAPGVAPGDGAAPHALPPGAHPPLSRPRPAEGPTCSEMALKRQEASLAVSLRYRPRLPRYSSMVTSLSDFCPKYFFQPFCIVPGRRRGRRSAHSTGGGAGRQWGSTLGAPRCGRSRSRARLERGGLSCPAPYGGRCCLPPAGGCAADLGEPQRATASRCG